MRVLILVVGDDSGHVETRGVWPEVLRGQAEEARSKAEAEGWDFAYLSDDTMRGAA